jgi:hypothetical protein
LHREPTAEALAERVREFLENSLVENPENQAET